MATVRIPIMNLFSGVARQPSSKRLTSELENVENAILTLERSAEKRPPLEFIHGGGAGGFLENSLFISDASPYGTADPDDIAYFFFDKTLTERYIIIINRSIAAPSNGLINIFKFREVTSSDVVGSTSPMKDVQKVRTGDCIVERVFDGTSATDQVVDFGKVDGTAFGYLDYDGNEIYNPVDVGTVASATVTITDFNELNGDGIPPAVSDFVNLIATDGTDYNFYCGDHDSVVGTWHAGTSNVDTATSLMNVINTSSGPAGERFTASVETSEVRANGRITITDFNELNGDGTPEAGSDFVNLIATDGTSHNFYCGPQSSVEGTWEATVSNQQTATNLMNVINTSSGPAGERFLASYINTGGFPYVAVTQSVAGATGNSEVTLTESGTIGMTKIDFTGGESPVVTITQAGKGTDGNTVVTLTDSGLEGMTKTDFTGGGRSILIDDVWEYCAYNPDGKPARDTLKATFFGSAIMILNNQVPVTTWTYADVTDGNNPSTHALGRKLTYRVAASPDEAGDYIMGGPYNSENDAHEPVGGGIGEGGSGIDWKHPITLFKGADGNGTIELSDFQANNVSDATYGLGTIKLSEHFSSVAATGTVTITDWEELATLDKINLIAEDGTNYDFVVGLQDLSEGTWNVVTSNDITAANLKAVISTSSGPAGERFNATVVGAVVTITQNTIGVEGDTAITLTDADDPGMSATPFTGGVDDTGIATVQDLVLNLNLCNVDTILEATDAEITVTISEFMSPGSGASYTPFLLNLDDDGNYLTGKMEVDAAGDIIQFYDGNGNTATHLGFSGTDSVFDAARKTGKNLQPYIADTSTVEDAANVSCTLNSLGGPPTVSDIITITHNGVASNWAVGVNNSSGTRRWTQLRDDLEAEVQDSGEAIYTLTLNSGKDGCYITQTGNVSGHVEGNLPDSVVDDTGKYAVRMGLKYDMGMHKPVRDDKVISPDIFENELGQNISNFNAIEIPPEGDDVNRVNGEEAALKALYGRTGIGNTEGFGKIWYCRSGFLTFPQGFYRCTSNLTIPHYTKVRAEDENSVLYEPTLPFLLINNDTSDWSVEYPEWNPRETGNAINNPGPQAFKADSDGSIRGRVITDIAFWRERLWFTVADMVFSSRNNDWFNLWLEDPNNITSEDPIDIRASSGKYTRINFMIPFDDFMFINTGGETQYELQGSNNVISPTTAELAPTSFYSASSIIAPLVLGTQIYWFDDERLYLYNSSAGTSVNNTTEVSIHAAGYLPKTFRCAAVAPAQDSIFVVDEDNPDLLYVYTARWAGGELAQNAFYRYRLSQTIVDRQITDEGTHEHFWDSATYWDGTNTTLPKPEIEYIWYSRNYLYLIVLRPAYNGSKRQRFIERTSLQFLDINSPRLERVAEIPNNSITGHSDDTGGNDTTWFSNNITYWRLPYWDPSANEIVLGPDWPTQSGQRLADTSTVTNTDEHTSSCTVLSVSGDWNSVDSVAYTSRCGSPYTMTLELTTINYRDLSTGFPAEGTLALRMMNVKHFRSGIYDVEIVRNNRVNIGSTDTDGDGIKDAVTVTTHTPLSINNSQDALGDLLVEDEGEFTVRVFGNSDTTRISITSDYPSPVSITSLEFIGKFKPYNSSIQS